MEPKSMSQSPRNYIRTYAQTLAPGERWVLPLQSPNFFWVIDGPRDLQAAIDGETYFDVDAGTGVPNPPSEPFHRLTLRSALGGFVRVNVGRGWFDDRRVYLANALPLLTAPVDPVTVDVLNWGGLITAGNMSAQWLTRLDWSGSGSGVKMTPPRWTAYSVLPPSGYGRHSTSAMLAVQEGENLGTAAGLAFAVGGPDNIGAPYSSLYDVGLGLIKAQRFGSSYRFGKIWPLTVGGRPLEKLIVHPFTLSASTVEPDGDEEAGEWSDDGVEYTAGDKVWYQGTLYICGLTHTSNEDRAPGEDNPYWDEWEGEEDESENWELNTQFWEESLVEHHGLLFVATATHTASADNEPGIGPDWESVWTWIVQLEEGGLPQFPPPMDGGPNSSGIVPPAGYWLALALFKEKPTWPTTLVDTQAALLGGTSNGVTNSGWHGDIMDVSEVCRGFSTPGSQGSTPHAIHAGRTLEIDARGRGWKYMMPVLGFRSELQEYWIHSNAWVQFGASWNVYAQLRGDA
jgi:hypothetical protein